MKNSLIDENATSIAHCFDVARIQNSPIFFWNSSGNGTCHLSKTLSRSRKNEKASSFAQCKEVAERERSNFFLWNATGPGTCYLLGTLNMFDKRNFKTEDHFDLIIVLTTSEEKFVCIYRLESLNF